MLARTTTALAVLTLAVPAAAFAHPGAVPHVHYHVTPLAVAAVVALVAVATLVFRKRLASASD